MPMMVFDRQHCRWRPWHGTRAAWLKLPHAMATGVCLLGTVALNASAPLPPHPPSPHRATAPRPGIGPPVAMFLPTPWLPTAQRGDGGRAGLALAMPMVLGGGTATGGPSPAAPPTVTPALPAPAPVPPRIVIVTTGLRAAPPRTAPSRTDVPEPGSASVLGAAVLALIALRRHSAPRPPRL